MTKFEIFSDPICPWCFIGKTWFDRAREAYPEQEFEDFCKQQQIATPDFEYIYQENNVFIQEFNQRWNKLHNNSSQDVSANSYNPFQNGYGDDMEASEYSNFQSSLSSTPPPSSSTPPSPSTPASSSIEKLEYSSDVQSPKSEPFQKEVVTYQEPQNYQNIMVATKDMTLLKR